MSDTWLFVRDVSKLAKKHGISFCPQSIKSAARVAGVGEKIQGGKWRFPIEWVYSYLFRSDKPPEGYSFAEDLASTIKKSRSAVYMMTRNWKIPRVPVPGKKGKNAYRIEDFMAGVEKGLSYDR